MDLNIAALALKEGIKNHILLAGTTIGAIISHATYNQVASICTIVLGIVGLISYIHSYGVKTLEKKKLELEIKELEDKHKLKRK